MLYLQMFQSKTMGILAQEMPYYSRVFVASKIGALAARLNLLLFFVDGQGKSGNFCFAHTKLRSMS